MTPQERMAAKQARHEERMRNVNRARETVIRERKDIKASDVAELDARLLASEREWMDTWTAYSSVPSVWQDWETKEIRTTYARVRPVSEMPAKALDSTDRRAAHLFRYVSDDNAMKGEQLRTRGTMRMMEAHKALVGCTVTEQAIKDIRKTKRELLVEVKQGTYACEDDMWEAYRDELVAHVEGTWNVTRAQARALVTLEGAITDMGKGNRLLDHATHKPR